MAAQRCELNTKHGGSYFNVTNTVNLRTFNTLTNKYTC